MQVVYGLQNLVAGWNHASACIGVFDGVHIGHQQVIASATEDARSHKRPCVVLTFDRNPLELLKPDRCPKCILTLERRLEKMRGIGADVCIVATFDDAFSQQTPQQFLDEVLVGHLKAVHVTVGHDFAFGKGRSGTTDWLATQISTNVVPPFERDGRRVSSTEIRNDIVTGKVREAARLLGSHYVLAGIVVEGQGLARKWGIPTANIAPIFDQVIPALGIYAGFAEVEGAQTACAISVGERPSVPGAGFAIEAHLLTPQTELYGRSMNLTFYERIREERRFSTEEDLVSQMKRDIEAVKAVLGAAV